MTGWKKVCLGDIIEANGSTYSSKDDWSFVNYLDTGNITKNEIGNIQFIDLTCEKLPSRAKRKVKFDSILYSTVRPNQLHYGIVKKQPENFLVSTGFIVVDVDTTQAVPDFVYYLLTQNEITEHLQAIGEQSVSAYPSIKPTDIENIEVFLPDMERQKKIVSILISIDNKIRENKAINKNLYYQLVA
jgi:restriction endonuclease S subunit